MKKIIFSIAIIIFIVLGSFASSVSETKVPVVVKASFYQDHSEAKNVKWEKVGEKDYKVNYRIGDNLGSIFYTNKGEFIESDITVRWKDVPLTGRMEIYHSEKGEIINTLKIVTNKDEVFYQVDMKSHNKRYEILLDNEGNIIK